jgi:multidrug resistance protein MdtO
MASTTLSLPELLRPLAWLREFLKEELTPYEGRAATVARMVIAATLVMIISVTFRIPYAAFGAIYSLLITRESSQATLHSAVTKLLLTIASTLYVLVSVQFVISSPLLHFLWVIGSLFVALCGLSVAADFGAASAFAIVIAATVPLWDSSVSAETKVEDTLWLTLSVLIGIMITTAVEVAFAHFNSEDEIASPIAERLAAVENLLFSYADGSTAERALVNKIVRLTIRGTSDLRRALQRSGYSSRYRAQMSSVVSLVGRLVDVTATLTELPSQPTDAGRKRLRNLAAHITFIRRCFANRESPPSSDFNPNRASSTGMPLLLEMEDTVALIDRAMASSNLTNPDPPVEDDVRRWKLLTPDALTNPEHLKFALKGWCAASVCYVIYSAINWPGISTAVTTCLVTALSTIGASRQKQVLRFGGALVGGFLIGTGSQVFVLPHLDSIGGFTILFVFVTGAAAWIMTSSPRLSYFGLQVAVAFYLINLQEFAIQTSLAIARDRVVGVLLGLFMMWLVFDQLGGNPAASEMKRTFVSGLRLLAQLEREPVSRDLRVASERSYALRETITSTFDQVRAVADGVLFEFGGARLRNLALRRQIIRWQPQLRLLFVIRISLWKYRAQLPGFELPIDVLSAQQALDDCLAQKLEFLAIRIEGKASAKELFRGEYMERFAQTIQARPSDEKSPVLQERIETLFSLYRETKDLLFTLDREIEI